MHFRNSFILTLFGFTICSKQFVGVHYKLYAGNAVQDSDASYLMQCLRTVMSTMNVEAVKFNWSTRVCTPLYHRWDEYAVIQPGEEVYTKTSVDVRYNPPMLIQPGNDLQYWDNVPGEMLPGSSLTVHTFTTQADAQVSMVLAVEHGHHYMTTLLHYDISKIEVGCKYYGTYCDLQDASDVTLLPNKEQKFTFIVVNDDIKLYLDGKLVIYYQDTANPMYASQTKFLTIWVNDGTYFLHNLVYEFADRINEEYMYA